MANTVFEVILVGDSGNIARYRPDPLMELLKQHLPNAHPSAVIFLGDNVYPNGLPEKGDRLRADAELVLQKHHEAVKNYAGKVIFISGNHDWNKGKDDGFDYVIRQEKYLEKLFGGENVYLPSNGCPGPKEVPVNDGLTIIAINTQWWIQRGFRPIGAKDGCSAGSEQEFYALLQEMIDRNINKKVLVVGHYPIYSYSLHGGKFKFKHHLFPLTIYKKKAFMPLPFVGSLLPLYRKYIGAPEDLSNLRFRELRKNLKAIFGKHPNLIYAAGHEHNLQHIFKNQVDYIVSGAASKSTYVRKGKYGKFALAAKGFFKLRFSPDQKTVVEAWIVDESNAQGKMVYQAELH
ncbi:metallophosphoesterase [uncultured Mucilaginibacter sp.]|uniref:metallophosphoesterase n=1 Tax=uncultured Mucilaginibacter sp. TaxID=797541 RepID=UPI002620AF99|nr:metallophosphoesterase [uncultured Mucilaginibacter sp.]